MRYKFSAGCPSRDMNFDLWNWMGPSPKLWPAWAQPGQAPAEHLGLIWIVNIPMKSIGGLAFYRGGRQALKFLVESRPHSHKSSLQCFLCSIVAAAKDRTLHNHTRIHKKIIQISLCLFHGRKDLCGGTLVPVMISTDSNYLTNIEREINLIKLLF